MSYITIDKNRCKSCYLCIDVCPNKLISKGSTIGASGEYCAEFKDENKKCTACAQCAMICPDIAIVEVVKE